MQFQLEGKKKKSHQTEQIYSSPTKDLTKQYSALLSRRIDTYKHALNDRQLGHTLDLMEMWGWRGIESLKM